MRSLVALAALVALPAAASTWEIDPNHTESSFVVKHLMVSNVRGQFGKTTGVVQQDDKDITKSKVEITIDARTIDTRVEKRDAHLKSPDFFDVERYPQATFTGKLVAPDRVEGELTLKGVSRPVTLSAKVNGPDQDPWGNERVGIDLEGEINRQEHGVTWNAPLPGGGALLDDTVKLTASLSFVKGA